jgi:outer membrane protein assembly factor BamB
VKRVGIVCRVLGLAIAAGLIAASGGCSSIKSTYDSWFGSPAPSRKPAELKPIRASIKARVAWQASVGAAGKTVLFPAMDGNAVWVADARGGIAGFNAVNGSNAGRFNAGQPIASGIAANQKVVVVGTPRGELLAFDLAGKSLWKTSVSGETLAPPVIDGDLLFARIGDGAVHAYDLSSGKRRWVFQRSSPTLTVRSHAGVVVNRGTVYAGFPGGRLVALSAVNGGVLWDSVVALPKGTTELERVADVTSPPVVDDSRACAVAFQGRTACFDPARGTSVWARDISSFSGIGADARSLYITDDKGAVIALDKSTGGSLWKQDQLQGRGVTRSLALGRYIVVGDYQGYVHLLSREDGSFLARIATDGSAIAAPAVALGLSSFLVQTRNGGVFAIATE